MRIILNKVLECSKTFLIVLLLFLFPSVNYSQTWWHSYKNPGETCQRGFDICQLSNEYFYIAGLKGSSFATAKINIIKINKYGNVLWSKFYSDSTVSGISAFACASSSDGGCVLSGYRNDAIPYSMKIDSNGNIIWNKTYENHNLAGSTFEMIRTFDNGYLLCGSFYILKIDSTGNYLWSHTDSVLYGNKGNIYSAIETSDNCFVSLGYSYSSILSPVISKFSQNGNLIWQKTFYNYGADVFVYKIKKLTNCFLLMGESEFEDPLLGKNYKYYFSKIDTAGNDISRHSGFDSTGKIEDFGNGLNVIDDNRFIFTSMDYSSINDSVTYTVFKIVDSNGIIKYKNIITDSNFRGGYEPRALLPLNTGHIMCSGLTHQNPTSYGAVFMARMDTTLYINPTAITIASNEIPKYFSLSQNYPNPFNPETRINFSIPKAGFVTLKIYDMLGRETATLVNEFKNAGNYITEFNASGLPSGVYYCKMISGDFSDVKKMVVVK